VSTQSENAERFRKLHVPGEPLVLVNAWDAVSARTLEALGFPALATTSAGIAWLEGFADGQRIGREAMLAGVARVCGAVALPVSADMEAGYGPSLEDAVATAQGVIDAGAIGLNFEDADGPDALLDAAHQVERIRALRRAADERGLSLVINARTDVFLNEIGPADSRLAHTLERGRLYRAAGADCIFVPGVVEPDAIGALAAGLGAPLNVLGTAQTPPLAELRRLGVARVSLGARPLLTALKSLRDVAIAIRDDGSFAPLAAALSHADVNALFT
jgi:2-methylisocitrate lyase-like PEP mutase family enzyme